jgi:hypothetical protein
MHSLSPREAHFKNGHRLFLGAPLPKNSSKYKGDGVHNFPSPFFKHNNLRILREGGKASTVTNSKEYLQINK